jgi:hypothetical protein
MWWSLSLLWPSRKTEVTWMAILFAIYPNFTQQPVASPSASMDHLRLYFLSIGLMLLSCAGDQVIGSSPDWLWRLPPFKC